VLTSAEVQNSTGAAIPSALAGRGSQFTVHYSQVNGSSGQTFATQRRSVQDGRLVHPARG
jgi:hypothetical protein